MPTVPSCTVTGKKNIMKKVIAARITPQRSNRRPERAPTAFIILTMPGSPQRTGDDQADADSKQDMRWAEKRLNSSFDAEELVPHYVADAASSEDEEANTGQAVAGGDRERQSVSPHHVIDRNAGECNDHE